MPPVQRREANEQRGEAERAGIGPGIQEACTTAPAAIVPTMTRRRS